ncbi:hypothetical protein GLOIN_2v1771472 [Rhizophagus clarus]|uniref:Uncharacterized protein n=1 Tax=Rhizophagus clarus TaxID=94130 RepID=A0A8H3LDV8_9GLOM|nr:hypothetical protein GLOIN_2v1771472 [Rhizophagus clarus]
MQQEFYSLIIRKCQELKYLDISSIKHQIFYFPEAKVRLESLCELKCDTSIDFSYFYGLSHFCQSIQRLIINNTYPKLNHGIVKLIEVQKNLKHFEWNDDFDDDDDVDEFTDKFYEEVFLALEKKADSLNYLRVGIQDIDWIENVYIQDVLPNFYKLKILIIDEIMFFDDDQLEKLRMMIYNELEVINIDFNRLEIISNLIENNGRNLKKLLFKPYEIVDLIYTGYDENSLNFIRKVYENCPSIEYLSIIFPPLKEHFIEFEKLLKICQNLKSLLIVISSNVHENYEGKLLEILIRSAPTNLKEIRFGGELKFSLENLKEFFEKWRGRNALSIITIDPIYAEEDYTNLVNKYKRDGQEFEFIV